ncbi:Ig-like domain-containing protein [Paenibacillus wulumuqiensis]|uniref:Ig-like domain-containing protein n=1 Tax=Paenibacillus wulumuqiensis TaxID=1567107 RepID=UPI0006979D6C|nr:Ig-like domain-containing protein [Paenibacillus wulumuqiensis]
MNRTIQLWTRSLLAAAIAVPILIPITAQAAETNPAADPTAVTTARIPAFPGAEGGGMYTTGGRGGSIYEVTNLNDSGPGSLRDAVSAGNRTIVFRISGNIHLKSPLKIKASNLTIAGQTAPGDGIAVLDYDTTIDSDNIIIRYMRFRLGDAHPTESDAFGLRKHKDIMIDHCSFSNSVDEVLSPYQNENLTVQWSIASESMLMSHHSKGRHGYGGIWGGRNVTFHHNLIAHNASRNPRFASDAGDTVDFRNNIIYNWQFMATYGGENIAANMVGNYYKYGPDTARSVRGMIRDTPSATSQWYIEGNHVDGYPDLTADNWLSMPDAPAASRLSEPVDMPYPIQAESAEQAYESILAEAGAILPKRDSIDARIMHEVAQRSGRMLNSPAEAGGYPELQSAEAPADQDHDGMPDAWEIQQGLQPDDPSDSSAISPSGYTQLEVYLNQLAGSGSLNPIVSLSTPKKNQLIQADQSLSVTADAYDEDGRIAMVEFYSGSERLGQDTTAPYEYRWNAVPEGTHYITARAIDDTGTAASSSTVVLHAVGPDAVDPWTTVDIGKVGVPGTATSSGDAMTVRGSGRYGEGDSLSTSQRRDDFSLTYQKLTGDFEMISRIDSQSRFDNNAQAGMMIRSTLDANAQMAALTQSTVKYGQAGRFIHRLQPGDRAVEVQTEDFLAPGYMKLVRTGDTVYAFLSQYGQEWVQAGSVQLDGLPDTVYAGFAADAASIDNEIHNYNTAHFSDISIRELAHMPSVPSNVYGEAINDGIQIRWTRAAEADTYNVERSLVENGRYTTVADTIRQNEWTDRTAEQGRLYYYRVTAIHEENASLPSAPVSAGLTSQQPVTAYWALDDFEQDQIGKPPIGYTLEPAHPGTATNHVLVGNLAASAGITVGNAVVPGSKGLILSDTGKVTTRITKRFKEQTGQVVLDTTIQLSANSDYDRMLQLLNTPGGYAAVAINADADGFSYYASSKEVRPLSQQSPQPGQWYHIRVIADIASQTADIYIDNQLAAEDVPFMNKVSTIATFTAQTPESGSGNLSIDNISIHSFAVK